MPGALNILNALATKGVEAVPKCVLVLSFLACVLRKKPFERQQQTTIFRLWTGHCRLLPHVFWLWLAHTEDCLCPGEPQSPEHVLQFCPLFREVRSQQWPRGATPHQQLRGNMEDLLKATTFVQASGLTTWGRTVLEEADFQISWLAATTGRFKLQ